jgi:hypothetical protein
VRGDAGRPDRRHARRARGRLVVALVVVLVAGGAIAVIASRSSRSLPPPVPRGDPGKWHLIFDDDFNGTSLDLAHWSTGWFGSGVTWPVNPTAPERRDQARVLRG